MRLPSITRATFTIILSASVLTGCGGGHALPPVQANQTNRQTVGVSPWVQQIGAGFDLFATSPYSPVDIANIPNEFFGRVLLDSQTMPAVGLMQMDGTFTVNPLPLLQYRTIAIGSDDKAYLTSGAPQIIRIDLSGTVESFNIPSGSPANSITLGPDGFMYFTENSAIGRITLDGTITEFPLTPNVFALGITTHPSGNVYFTEFGANMVGKMDTQFHTVYYSLDFDCGPSSITVSGDHTDLMLACLHKPSVVKLSPNGVKLSVYDLQTPLAASPRAMVLGSDRATYVGHQNLSIIDRISTNGNIQHINQPGGLIGLSLSLGADGNVWIANPQGQKVSVLIIDRMSVKPSKLKFTGIGQTKNVTVSERGFKGPWTATSSNNSVATVAPGPKQNIFVVTSQGSGNCNIVIADNKANFFDVFTQVP